MRLERPVSFCMAATPFKTNGDLDEAGFRAHLRRMVESGTAVYLGSGGAGEGHALSLKEVRRVYDIGVEECKGKVPTYANPPEPRTAKMMVERCKEAASSGVDVVQIYQMDAGHSMRPTAMEQEHYYKTVLDGVDHPVALSMHVYAGFSPSPKLFRQLCESYPQIVACNIMGATLDYFVQMKDALDPRINLFTGWANAMEMMALGSKGFLAAEPNITPYLCRSVIEHFLRGETRQCGEAIGNWARLATIVNRWSPSTARWVKMAMKVLDQPGGTGVLREPYMLPPPAELAEMKKAFDNLGLNQIEEAARRVCQSAAKS